MARPLRPGDDPRYQLGLRDGHRITGRGSVHFGQITGLTPETGIAKVTLIDNGQEVRCVIPLDGLTANTFQSSWRRYMPREKDFVLVSFDGSGQPWIVGNCSFGEIPGEQHHGTVKAKTDGYARFRKLREDGVAGFREWFDLKRGEWHDRSSGGASVYGTAGGQLMLGAGPSQVTLDKPRYEITGRTGLLSITSGVSRLDFGDVKKQILPTDVLTSPVPPAPAAAGKEWHLRIATSVAPFTPDLVTYDENIGDVYDNVIPRIGPIGLTKVDRHLMDGSPLGTTLWREQIDNLGNLSVTHGPTATSVSYSGALASFSTSYLRTTISSTTTTVIASDLPAAGVFLGSASAHEPVIKGATFAIALAPLAAALTTFAAAYAVAHPTDPDGIAAAAVAPLAGALALALLPGAALSLKVFTE